jgi:hypothetical protein
MRRLSAIGAVVLGVVGIVLCAAAIGFGWWAAVTTIDRVSRVAASLDHGLSEADARLARVEERSALFARNSTTFAGRPRRSLAKTQNFPGSGPRSSNSLTG